MLRNLLQGAGFITVMSLALAGCQPAERIEVLSGPTMGSTYTIKYVANSTTPAADAAGVAVQEILDEVDRQMSTWRTDSDLSRFNRLPAGSCRQMPAAVIGLVSYAQQLSASTDGQFDITAGPLLKLWGFDANSRQQQVPTDEQLGQALAQTGYQHLHISGEQLCKDKDLQLDLSSVAAGYAVDRIAARFAETGLSSYMIEVTGELYAVGKKPDGSPWRIGIELPAEGPLTASRIVEIDGLAVNTSGDYRNYFEQDGVRFSHVINARSGKPVTHRVAAVTVIDSSTLVADALGTVLLLLGLEDGMQYSVEHDVAAMFVERNGDNFVVHYSPRFISDFPEGE